MSAQNSAGIQTLLDAEREAQKIVQKEYRPYPADKRRQVRGPEGDRGIQEPEGRGVQEVRGRALKRIQGSRGGGRQGSRGQAPGDQGIRQEAGR
ncbi:Vacuolar (H+)-ATPase G subunit [Penicillium camemberti]|uniref:Vacuolar (H+)-ATPase G subunit n=1 Tax=Penicillium camemberti (strain FM 013) TaxID=1429867 RepID=A0A0G4PAG2_PENC3|nr:Vacuolar (H+)-ATPase G subunit [Penicillium camemberti]